MPILAEADLVALLATPGRTLAPAADARIVTKRSWAPRAAQDEMGLPFSSTANTTVWRIRPERVQARSVVPVFPCTWPRSEGRRLLSVPLTPATASEPTKALRIDGSFAAALITPTSVSAVSRSRLESPEPSTMRTPCDGDPGVAHRGDHEPAAACRRARLPRRGGELLEEHLGVEVVALVVHVANHQRERVGDVGGERHGGPRRDPEPGPPADRDAVADESVAKGACGEQGRRERGPAARAVDDERRERWRLAAGEVRLPAGSAALRVVERLVATDPPAHREDAPARGSSPRAGRGPPSRASGRRSP